MTDYKTGDTITYYAFGNTRRDVRVTERHADIKNGRPGFDGVNIADDMPVLGYDDQITDVHPATSTPLLTAEHPKGLPIEFYRRAGQDCTNGGISSEHAGAVVVGVVDISAGGRETLVTVTPLDQRSQVFTATGDRPAVWLHRRNLGGSEIWSIVPATPAPTTDQTALRRHMSGWMVGGAYGGTPDSRFRAITGMYGAVAVHDRTEW